MAKRDVQPNKNVKYQFQKIKMCKNCQRYSVLKDPICPVCGKHYKKVHRLVRKSVIKRLFMEALWILTVTGLGVIIAPKTQTMYYLAGGVMFCISYIIVTSIFLKSEYHYQLKKRLRKDLRKIQAGIRFDSNLAKEAESEGQLEAAYEKLCEIGDFVYSDEVKIRQVIVLNKLPLRSGGEPELERLIPSSYDKNFVKYALKVLKQNRARFTKRCIAYFIRNRENIMIDFGGDALIAIADTALRMKLYILEYSSFIEEFLPDLPKERIQRLCSILYANPDLDWGSLKVSTMELVGRKYRYDPEFKRFLVNERVISRG
ncbi:hypothetical protein COJ85_18430 [Bacillus sp. AFS076308]|uniref:hypothetical protein n=1 Tax=unclassified Bacillus (in: firmicutes) TaxID=185979 RepID=UPI000BF57B3F|nr:MULTISPECIES: hypothetical protein [unclassified Bacillus (in: firmicutes)]PFO00007.1 hypothetical protein COJ85_18430 [Bacillus sp. AFS076308]PGV51550.1 hypothetical protein COD92_13725 [Bacillus sp. AFS037270]